MQATNQVSLWLTSLQHQAAKSLSVLLLVSWASLLTVYTIQLQHSCKPLLEWTDLSAKGCPPKISASFRSSQPTEKFSEANRQLPKAVTRTVSIEPSPQTGEEESSSNSASSNLAGMAVGSIAVVGLAVMETPLVIAAGVGIIVWLAASTLLSSGS